MKTETITKAIDKAQNKGIHFFFLRKSGIFHRGDMQRQKKKKKTVKKVSAVTLFLTWQSVSSAEKYFLPTLLSTQSS